MKCPHCEVHIDEHEASRCLDAWVAEAVMGCSPKWLNDEVGNFEHGPACWCGGYPENRDMSTQGWPHDKHASKHGLREIAYYSTDIAAAWEVVEKVNVDNAVNLRWYNPAGRTSVFSVALGFGTKIGAEADTAPLAICRAAIKATAE